MVYSASGHGGSVYLSRPRVIKELLSIHETVFFLLTDHLTLSLILSSPPEIELHPSSTDPEKAAINPEASTETLRSDSLRQFSAENCCWEPVLQRPLNGVAQV